MFDNLMLRATSTNFTKMYEVCQNAYDDSVETHANLLWYIATIIIGSIIYTRSKRFAIMILALLSYCYSIYGLGFNGEEEFAKCTNAITIQKNYLLNNLTLMYNRIPEVIHNLS